MTEIEIEVKRKLDPINIDLENNNIEMNNKLNKIIYTEKKKAYIDRETIFLVILQYKKDILKEQIKNIRYLNEKYDAYEILKENEKINIRNGLKILVKIEEEKAINENQALKKKEIVDKISSLETKIKKEISKLNKEKKLGDYRPSSTFSINKGTSSSSLPKTEEQDTPINLKEEVEIIVLTANPLIYHPDDQNNESIEIEDKQLKTMNDFNLVTNSINKVIMDCNKQIRAKFLPLTPSNLKKSISQNPKILHLLCKSTYFYDKNIKQDNDNYIPILLFENKLCQMEKINKENFTDLIDSNDTTNISLFISTPLSEDIFEMVKSFNFKNIMVQHTTLANIEFISEFNEQLYKNIIELNKPLKEAIRIAKIDSKNVFQYQFCCCFHKHLKDCKFKMNLSNELYFDNDKKDISKEVFQIPHFYHLRYQCNCEGSKDKDKDFCTHDVKTCDNYCFTFKPLSIQKTLKNICCCAKLKKKHDYNFFCRFSSEKEEEDIFWNYRNNNFSTIINQQNVPDYGKMNVIVGRNSIIYNIYEIIRDKTNNILNIYPKNYKESINIIDSLINLIKEFLKERIPYLNYDDPDLNFERNNFSNDLLLKKNLSNNYNIDNEIKFNYNSSPNLDLVSIESAPMPLKPNLNNDIPTFETIYFQEHENSNNISIINDLQNSKNKVYFINGLKIKDDENLIKILNQKDLSNSQIIIFTENKIDKNNLDNQDEKKIIYLEMEKLNKIDYQIELQNLKIKLTKPHFDSTLDDIIKEKDNEKDDLLGKSTTILKDNPKSNLIYEILFLFNCSNSGLFGMEMEALFPKNVDNIISIIKEKYLPKKIIIYVNYGKFYRYNRNNLIFNAYYEQRKDKISNKIKQILLEKLFCFYARAFREVIKRAKFLGLNDKENKIQIQIQKKYKPNESLTSFSAVQELGMWLPFENKKIFGNKSNLAIYNVIGYFNHLFRNFKSIFNKENIFLCLKNADIWKNVRDSIEDLSITLGTFLIMTSSDNLIKFFSIFANELYNSNNYSIRSVLRFKLLEYMYREYYTQDNKNEILKNLELIQNGFNNIGYIEGELETMFAKCIVNFRNNTDIKKFEDIYTNEIMVKLIDLKNNQTYPMKQDEKDNFIVLFENKVKYTYIKYKIKLGILSDNDLEEMEQMIIVFKKKEYINYVIKVCFLISEWYLKQYKIKNENMKNSEELLMHLSYLNMTLYIGNNKNKQKYLNYIKEFILKKFEISQRAESNKIKEKITILCNKYEIPDQENKINQFYVYDK